MKYAFEAGKRTRGKPFVTILFARARQNQSLNPNKGKAQTLSTELPMAASMAASAAQKGALTDQRFSELSPTLSPEVVEALDRGGFQRCTPMQAAAIPHLLSHKNVIVDGATSSGKTLAFIVPIVEILHHRSSPPKSHEVASWPLTSIRP
jgi:superfamily II DNA/RNA helicase